MTTDYLVFDNTIEKTAPYHICRVNANYLHRKILELFVTTAIFRILSDSSFRIDLPFGTLHSAQREISASEHTGAQQNQRGFNMLPATK